MKIKTKRFASTTIFAALTAAILTTSVLAVTVPVGDGSGYINVYSSSGYAETNAPGMCSCSDASNSPTVSVSISCLQNNGQSKSDGKTNTGRNYTTAWVSVSPESNQNFLSGSASFSYYRCNIHCGSNSATDNA